MRRDTRRRQSGSRLSWGLLAIGVFAVLVYGLTPAGLATTGQLEREATVDVAADDYGVLALDVAQSVRNNRIDPLVNVTNNYELSVSVTVTLQNGNDGDLYLDGTNVGDEATFTLGSGNLQTVEFEADTSAGSTVYFDVTGSAADLDVTALDRTTNVKSPGGGGPPGGGP